MLNLTTSLNQLNRLSYERVNMSTTTKTSPDKIKLLDQMLEDIAGDEYEEFEDGENFASSDVKRHSLEEDLDFLDTTH
jgi:hypothetical protein